MRPFVILMLTSGNHLAKPYDGMWQFVRVAKEQVEQPADEQGKGISHGSRFDRFVRYRRVGERGQPACRIALP